MSIAKIIRMNLPLAARQAEITPEADLRDIGADELTFHAIALDLEEAIGREIPDPEAEEWVTVADVMKSAGEGAVL